MQQSCIKMVLIHLTLFQKGEVPLLLSSLFQIIHEVPDNWWYTTIGYKAVTETLHAPFDKLRCRFSCHLHFKNSMKILTIVDIQQSYINLLLKHFMPFPHIEVSLFLSSPFQIIHEDPDNWWYTTIVYKAATEKLHGLLTKWGVAFPVLSDSNIRWRSWQLMIYNNRI